MVGGLGVVVVVVVVAVGSGRDTTRKNVYCNEKKTIIITLESLK